MDYNDLKGQIKVRRTRRTRVRNPRHYRLDFIKENTFNRLWSIRMTRTRVWLGGLTFFAAVAALIFVVFAFTPMRRLLPVSMEKTIRAGYLETSLKLDSLERVVERQAVYNTKVSAILDGKPVSDTIPPMAAVAVADSDALAARENEKRFVKAYEGNQRFNLSVLAPIAAEGMAFGSPVGGLASRTRETTDASLEISTGRNTPATAVYKGAVVALVGTSDGMTTVVIQHPNDFLSVYGGLREVFVEKGASVVRGQRIGHTAPPDGLLYFELWHNGTALRPSDYIDTI